MDQRYIRNFSIIAHIDHGKSTLADRFLELTGALRPREMEAQVLDTMDLERERGITIKAHAVRLTYTPEGGVPHVLNLIDTPGHVDFSYEVTRALTACEGAVLLVDASQGVEAQTVANAYLAVDQNLEIVSVVNKIDLPGAQPEETARQIEEIVGLDAADTIMASAKEGDGTRAILDAVIARIPPPAGDPDAPLKALIFDSWYDSYRGVVVLIRVVDGAIRPKMKVRLMARGRDYEVEQVGVFLPKLQVVSELTVGDVGFVIAGAALGPHGLGALAQDHPFLGHFTITEQEATEQFAELGVLFLLFMLGLEFSFEKLWGLRHLVFGAGSLQVGLSAVFLTLAAWFAGTGGAGAGIVVDGHRLADADRSAQDRRPGRARDARHIAVPGSAGGAHPHFHRFCRWRR